MLPGVEDDSVRVPPDWFIPTELSQSWIDKNTTRNSGKSVRPYVLTFGHCCLRTVARNLPCKQCHCKEEKQRSSTHSKGYLRNETRAGRILSGHVTQRANITSKIHLQRLGFDHQVTYNKKIQKRRDHLFFSSPVRKAASANEARRLPLPASPLQTAYSLTKACIWIISRRYLLSKQNMVTSM